MDEEMGFLLDDSDENISESSGYWNIMVVDDDTFVHEATKFALSGFKFLDKKIRWFDAYSSDDAKKILEDERDMALLFLDVVMETDDAGLNFAKWFRDTGVNPSTRIILRTGQPGQAPERQVIVNFDLHDYKTKTELSADKLFTTTVAALRAYYDMNRLEMTKVALEGIIKATGSLFQVRSMYEYAASVLSQIGSVLDIRSSGIICAQTKNNSEWEILAESGSFSNQYDKIISIITQCAEGSIQTVTDDYMVKILSDSIETRYAIYIEPVDTLNDIQSKMLLMFCTNISIGLKNIKLYNNLLDSHKATVMSLAEITESRDHDTGEHVFRIARGAERLCRELYERNIYRDEISPKLYEVIGLSATLHDIGKVSIPDSILLKPGRLTPEEFEIIKTHASQGAKILETAIRTAGEHVEYLEIAKRIALYHHERWDGKGYPTGKSGKDIPIEARITAINDVFDALVNKRCYKNPYSVEQSIDIIKEGRGSQFDPLIVDVFVEIIDQLDLLEDSHSIQEITNLSISVNGSPF